MSRRRQPIDTTLPASATSAALAAVAADVAALDAELTAVASTIPTVGPTGAMGAPGSDGEEGEPGPMGPPGPQGATGATGATGAKGNAGADGTNGTNGARGPQGDDGEDGAIIIMAPSQGRQRTIVAQLLNTNYATDSTEKTVVTYSNTAQVGDSYDLYVEGWFMCNVVGGDILNFRIKIGGTTYIDFGYGTTNVTTRYPFVLRARISNIAASKQSIHGYFEQHTGTGILSFASTTGNCATVGFGITNVAFSSDNTTYPNKDWTTAQAVAFTVQQNVSNANAQINIDLAQLTFIPGI